MIFGGKEMLCIISFPIFIVYLYIEEMNKILKNKM